MDTTAVSATLSAVFEEPHFPAHCTDVDAEPSAAQYGSFTHRSGTQHSLHSRGIPGYGEPGGGCPKPHRVEQELHEVQESKKHIRMLLPPIFATTNDQMRSPRCFAEAQKSHRAGRTIATDYRPRYAAICRD